MTTQQPINPKFAKTDFRVVKIYRFQKQQYCLYECRLHTGRTHQIRLHCQEIGTPII